MGAARNKVSFVIIGVLAAFVLALFCQPLAADCVSVLANGWGSRRYLTAAAGGDRVVLVSREDADFRLTLGTADGRRTGTRHVTLPVSAAGSGTPFDILPAVWLASALSVGVGVTACKLFARIWRT